MTKYLYGLLRIYPKLTSGGSFIPIEGMNIADIYLDVSKKIISKGYEGIYVIYDEFSKFLESSLNQTTMELKKLQDFAEMCNGSKESQVHIMLISHKTILNYVNRLPIEKINSWKAVGERFKEIELKNLPSQMYEIISKVIVKEDTKKSWTKFKEKYREEFNNLIMETSRSGLFCDVENIDDKVVYNPYPLHPTTLFSLPRISEKVAQNERTLFTFLSTNNMNTLMWFLEYTKEKLPFLTIDMIFDYFEIQFKREPNDSEIYKIWRRTANSIKKIHSSDLIYIKILKALAVIYIVNEFNKFPPKFETIIFALESEIYTKEELQNALNSLIDNKLIWYSKSRDTLNFIESSGVNIDEEIKNVIDTRRTVFDIKKVLNECIIEKYLYPIKYNDMNNITRFFEVEFLTYEQLQEIDNWDKKIGTIHADGVFFSNN